MTLYNRTLSGFLGAVFGLMLTGNSFAIMSPPLPAQTQNGISFLSGGASENERHTLRQMTRDDNVQLIFAAKNGDYLSDVTVRITDEKGHEVLNTVAPGPWLFTKLPAGKYMIKATVMGHSQGAVAEVSLKARTHVFLTWENAIEHPRPQSVMHRVNPAS